MAVALNHVLVPAHDSKASARYFAELFGLRVEAKSPGSSIAHFDIVLVGDTRFDFANIDAFEPHHYGFLVSEEEFDTIFARVREAGIEFSADPMHRETGRINHRDGGRGIYFRELNGHNLELLTRRQTI